MLKMNIGFLTKIDKPGVKEAISFTKKYTEKLDIFSGDRFDPLPEELHIHNYDILFSYISPWIVPKNIIKRTKKWNINFHPGPPEYPGIGCFNFAIYNDEKKFGCTAHIMEPKVDTGNIIAVKRFEMKKDETVNTLATKTYEAILNAYKELLTFIYDYGKLPNCYETWQRKPYKRKELEELATIKPNMSQKEIRKRIRATYYPGQPAPFIDVHGYKFEYNPDR